MRYISRFKNSIRASSVYSLAFMLTFTLAAGLTTYEEAAAQPSIKLSVMPDSIDEDQTGGSLSVTITAQASAGFADNTNVVLLTIGGSATRDEDTTFEMGDDYRISDSAFNADGKIEITIDDPSDIGGVTGVQNSSGSVTFQMELNDDGAFERPESIDISGALSGSFVTGTSIELLDDDYDITLTTDNPSISENAAEPESVEVTATLASMRTSPVTVSLNFSGTATSSYYTAGGTHSITIGARNTTGTATVTVDPNDNDTYGGDQTIIVGGTSGDLQVKPAPAVSISDNEEMPDVKLTLDPSTINEDAGLTRVTAEAELDGDALESTLTVKLNVVAPDADNLDATSTASSDDYDLGGTQSISISAGSKSGSTVLLFTPDDDPRFEGDVNEIVVIVTDSGDMVDMEGRATITIVENDFDLVLSLDTSMVSEDSDDPVELELTATLQGGDRTNDLNIPLVLGTLPTGYTVTINDVADTSPTDDSITIDAGDLTGTAKVTVTSTNNDEVYSGNMTVDITANATGINDKGATITMVEDEAKPTIELSIDDATVTEGGDDSVEVTATLSGAHTGTVTVTLSFSGTAEKGDMKDYTEPTGQTINISNGLTGDTMVDLMLFDDEAFENAETIVISGTSLPALDVSSVTVNVEDDDFDVELSIPATTINEAVEDAQSVVVTATLQSARTSPLTIALNFSGSASSSEYVLGGTTTITVPPGPATTTTGTATITIDPVDNALRGGDKMIMVGGTASGVNLKAATNAITIMDDETAPTVAIKLSPDKLNEDAGTASVTVTAEVSGGDPLASAATIELTVEDSDAVDSGTTMANEDDYSVTGTQSITIRAGARSGSTTLSFAVVDDPLFEMSETITISATTDAPVADGDTETEANIAAKTLTIVDNDFDIRMSVDKSSIAEDSADATDCYGQGRRSLDDVRAM